jgi:hypothetical protein
MKQPKPNPTLELIDMLVTKHKLDWNKTVQYVDDNCRKSLTMKLFLSGFIFDLSINRKNIKQKLS